MIDILKKRHKIGDVVTLHTVDASFTGVIDAFEENCVILSTDEVDEFIANDTIKRISIPKIINTEKKETIKEIEIKLDEAKVVMEEEDKTEKVQEVLIKTEYKAGDKIPLEELEKRKDKKIKLPKTKGKGIVLSSLSDLRQLILPETEAENKKIVSANGTIVRYFGDRNFGFITDKFGYDIWFGFNNVIDESLLQTLRGTVTRANIPILFTLTKNYKGDSATHIHKPKTVEQVAELANQYFEKERKPDIALGLVDQILFSFPENYTAIKLREEIDEKRYEQPTFIPTFKSYDNNFQKGQQAHISKNYKEALEFYKIAFNDYIKRESCIKNISMLYLEWDKENEGMLNEGLIFLQRHEKELPQNSSTYFFLENYYGKAQKYDKQISNIDFLLEVIDIFDKKKYPYLLSKKAFGLYKLNRTDEAREILEEVISLQPEYTYATRLLNLFDDSNNEEIEKLINEDDFWNFGSGISRWITESLENCKFKGLRATVIEKGEFSKSHLSEISELIKEAGAGRPTDRADYLLTEAKLLQILEPENDKNLNNVLIRFCNTKAFASIQSKHHLDVVRYYFLEAFSLEDSWDETEWEDEKQVASDSLNRSTINSIMSYLWSFKASYLELLTNQPPSFKVILENIFREYNEFIWNSVTMMFLNNRAVALKITSKLFKNKLLREKSLLYLNKSQDNNISIDEYADIWNEFIEKRQRDYSRWFASLKAISNNLNLETLTNILLDSINEAKKNWLTQLDTSRLNIIATDIYEVLATYLRNSGYRDKERSFNFAKAQINQLIIDIRDKPTRFSYEGFIPLLEKIEILLDKSFKTVEAASNPKVEISILGEANVLGNDNVVPFQLKVESSKNSSPIHNIKIIVQTTDDITFIEKSNEYFDSLDGGESHIFNLSVKVSNKIANEKATSINITCYYNNRSEDEPVKLEKQLSLRLYSENEFETIPNPYEKLANGGPVTDRSMFYGRNEFIDRITEAIISTDSKQVVIYGQKRSGKSSVLHHLKKSLENSQKTFCISFSIGEIFENISSSTFFHKILFTIEEELENLSFDGIEVPSFKCPSYTELKDAPNSADIFRKYLRNFKRACQNTQNWQGKKLVIMIDEFTYLYTAIKEKKVSDAIMKQWKAITQNEDATFSSVLVGQDVFPQFKSEFPNEFGVTQDERLTYLSKRDALKLIEEPVWNTNSNKSRYLEDGADKIIEYTSCNPYYIQIFCARLIKEMNDKKFIEATRSDIKPIADSFLFGGQALTNDKFDNLLNAGEKHDIQRIPQEHSKAVLKKIAEATKFVPYCSRENISIGDKEYEDLILDDLKNREVIEQQGNNFKIQVKLFQEWLLKN